MDNTVDKVIAYFRRKKGLSNEDAKAAALQSGDLEMTETGELRTKKKKTRGLINANERKLMDELEAQNGE